MRSVLINHSIILEIKSIYSEKSISRSFVVEDIRVLTSLKEIDDSQLWIEFQSGSENAFATIYRNNAPILYTYGLKLITDKDIIGDCIQDLFIEIWNNKHKLGQVRSIQSYLFKSLRRKLISEISKQMKKVDFANKKSIAEPITFSEERKLVEKQKFDFQLQKLKKVMEKLTHKQKEIIYLKFFAQLSYPEIAEIMNISQKGAYKLMGRSIQFLRKQMDGHF